MKDTLSENLNDAFKYLKSCGREDLVSYCKNEPCLGDDQYSREINSWITILGYLIYSYKETESDDFFEKEFDKFFLTVPIEYRDVVYPRIDDTAREMGIIIGLDVSNCKANENHIVEHIGPDDARVVLIKTHS